MKHKKPLIIVATIVAVLLVLSAIGNSLEPAEPSAGGASAPPSPTPTAIGNPTLPPSPSPTASGAPAPSPSISMPVESSAPAPTETPPVTDEPKESADPVTLEYGDLLELNDNREAGGVVVVKAKISPLPNGNYMVSQNYYNVMDLIQNQGFGDCELQYWAVADFGDGEEKAISFTIPPELSAEIENGGDMSTQLPDLVSDLWLHSGLQN